MTVNELTIEEAHKELAAKNITARELTEACLRVIEERDDEIHAFLEVYDQEALQAADATDKRLADGEAMRPLEGIPIAIKDNMCMQDKRTTAGSKMLERYVAPYDATAVAKLKEAGAVIIGKTNMDEFAMGSSTENSAFGPTKNPHDLTRVPGGSSGGSSAAVAAGMSLAALGSDTGGSIRQPASFCGVVGLKPSYGRVSRHGLIAMGSSLDQIGPLTRTVHDAEVLYDVLRGEDDLDTTTRSFEESDSTSSQSMRIGVPEEYFAEGIAPDVEKRVRGAIARLEESGMTVEEISLPHTAYALATYYIIMPSEVSANLARYDNVRYQGAEREELGGSLIDAYKAVRGEAFGNEVRRRIMLGTYTLSAGYFDAYYARSQRVRSLIRKDFDEAFSSVDVIITPTSPTTAFLLGERTEDPLAMYLSDIYTVTANLAGIPGVSVPISGSGLPAGLQVLGPHGGDKRVLGVAGRYAALL